MTSTTLITFLLQTPRHANRVELLGSWDNFSRPYAMRRDRNVGSAHWRGCHSFTDIICDGETLQAADEKRNGALLMGGKYWYFYRLDDDLEYCNPKEPSTTACPLLPGQCVNVLEVPLQMETPDVSGTDASQETCAAVFTLDPEDKYRIETTAKRHAVPLRAASCSGSSSLSATSGLCIARPQVEPLDLNRLNDNLLHLNAREADAADVKVFKIRNSQSLPCSRQGSMRSTFKGLRRCKSAREKPEVGQVHLAGFRGWLRHDRDGPTSAQTQAESIPAYYLAAVEEGSMERANIHEIHPSEALTSPPDDILPVTTVADTGAIGCTNVKNSKLLNLTAALKPSLDLTKPSSVPCMLDHQADLVESCSSLHNGISWLKLDVTEPEHLGQFVESPSNGPTETVDQATGLKSEMARMESTKPAKPKHLSFISSNRTSGVFSFSSSMSFGTEPSSPIQQASQPITPTLDGFFESPVYHAALPSQPPNTAATGTDQQVDAPNAHRLFPGYSLPAEDYSSAQTLRPQGSADKDASRDLSDAAQHVSVSPQSRTALQELVDDMGYLGAIIG